MWKKRLRSAIDNGKAGAIPVELAKNNVFLRAMAVRADNSIAVRDSADYRSLNFTSIFIKARQKLEFMAQGQKAQADPLTAGGYA